MLINYDPVTAPNAYKEAANWKAIDASAAKLDVVNNLTSTSESAALSAAMGKELNDRLDTLTTKVTGVYVYKGSVDSYAQLPTTNNQVGDVYNVVAANGNIPAGTNYAWNGTAWDALGGAVDLSVYYTKTETENLVTEKVEEVSGNLTTLESKVSANTDALTVINGAEDTKGSLANTLKTAKDYTDTQLTAYVSKTDEKYLKIDNLDTRLTTAETKLETIDTLETKVDDNTTKLNTLMSADEATEGSVKNTVNTAITNALSWEDIK